MTEALVSNIQNGLVICPDLHGIAKWVEGVAQRQCHGGEERVLRSRTFLVVAGGHAFRLEDRFVAGSDHVGKD
ncbi:MAG: hypothetical protein ACRD4O_11690 [Bryobacteraceae bacterium]